MGVTREQDMAIVYGALCDVAARLLYGIPEEDSFSHTGSEPRRLARLAWERAGLDEVFDEAW